MGTKQALGIVALLLLATACKTTHNFPAKEGPIAKSPLMKDRSVAKDQIKVISFNIEYAKKIDEAIEELRTTPTLQNADLLLLQEMDEGGTQRIADSLDFNYVYYPATINRNAQDFFGNAILSKWPITEEEKWVLPYPNPHNKGIRIFMGVSIHILQQKVRVYNVHSETIVRCGGKRLKQHQLIAQKIQEQAEEGPVILGGDFNTFFRKNRRQSVELFESIGLTWANHDVKHTAESFWFKMVRKRYDHVFFRGFEFIDAGRNAQSIVGDHFPLWVTLRLK
ncbi:MAG: endonuclease/exonuclease/phosphatase family protein [Bacteroidota bacterium]